MQIRFETNTVFKRRLNSAEEADFTDVLKTSKEKLGNNGNSILIVPSASLPQSARTNTGVGNILDKESLKFFDFAKQYWGINTVQLLPEGNYKYKARNVFPYSGSALDLGTQLINIPLLASDEYGNLLSNSDIKQIVDINNSTNKATRINYENVILTDSKTEEMLRKAYKEMLKGDSQKKKNLIQEFDSYKKHNNESLTRKNVFQALSKKYNSFDFTIWNDFDKNLYNPDIIKLADRESAIQGILASDLAIDADFYSFKQFIAEKHLAEAKKQLNKRGLKLSGDMLVGFSYDEVWANPKAFHTEASIGWGLPALNFDSPEGEKLLREKVNKFAKRYDMIRVDASWSNIVQPRINQNTGSVTLKDYGSRILDIIDDEIIKVKGKDFSPENIMHEFVTDSNTFNSFDGRHLRTELQNRTKIYTSEHLSKDWGNTQAYRNRGWKNGSYILGATNHDSAPLRVDFANTAKRDSQIKVLAKILNIPESELTTFSGFSQARFAEPMRSKHNMLFFTEALNIAERYKDNSNYLDDYRIKISENYQEKYFSSLEKGEGFNIMDALDKAFVAEGLDKKEQELYKRIVKYKKILQAKESDIKSPAGKIALIAGGALVIIASALYILLNNKNGSTKHTANN